MDTLQKRFLAIAMTAALVGCGTQREYSQAYETEFTAAKKAIVVNGYERRGDLTVDPADDAFPVVDSHGEFAVRFMGVDRNGDPILQVITPGLKRTNVTVERAETDRVHVGAYGVRDVTVVVVDATDDLLTYRLQRDDG